MNIENMTSKELKEMAKELKVKNWWTLKKAELIAEITAAQTVEEEVIADEAESAQVESEEVIAEESKVESEASEKPSRKNADLIEYNGKTQSLSAWAKELGMPGQTLYARLRISNWPVEKAFTTPTRRKKSDEE